MPLDFLAAIRVAVTVSWDGAARDGALGAAERVIFKEQKMSMHQNCIPLRNVTAALKLSASDVGKNAVIATKLKMDFGCNAHIHSVQSQDRQSANTSLSNDQGVAHHHPG